MRAAAGALVALLVAACAAADGEVRGGELQLDAQPSPEPPALGGNVCLVEAPPEGAASTFTALHADYFGPTGKASCSAEGGGCHGTADDKGALASQFVCGTDRRACWESMRGASGLVNLSRGDQTNPMQSGLIDVLRREGGLGRMPLRPGCLTFSTGAIERIATWMRAGANDD